MKPERLAELINSPWKIKEDEVPLLRAVVDNYPFFTTARLLYLYSAWKYDRINYDKHLSDIPTLSVSPLQINYWLNSEPIVDEDSLKQNNDLIQNNTDSNSNETNEKDWNNIPSMEKKTNENEPSDQLNLLQEQILQDRHKSLNELETLTVKNAEFGVKNDNQISNENSIDNSTTISEAEENNNIYDEKKNFLDWLKTYQTQSAFTKESFNLSKEVIQEVKTISDVKLKKRKKQWELLDKIIEMDPGPIKIKTSEPTASFYQSEKAARESLLESEEFVTETLANIYLSQGHYSKAIRVYEILSLKFPQKNTYFAEKIKEIKNLKNKEL